MKMFKKNKRGFLLAEETLKIIIAVICILFLVYLLVALYNSNSAEKKILEAKDVLSRTSSIISSLGDGESENQDIPNPKGWHLYSFVGEEKPNSCLNDNCLCICGATLIKQLKSQASKCDKEGTCLVVERLAATEIDYKISSAGNLLFIEIKKQNGRIFVEEAK
jgi:hypothetical protein